MVFYFIQKFLNMVIAKNYHFIKSFQMLYNFLKKILKFCLLISKYHLFFELKLIKYIYYKSYQELMNE